MKSVTRPPIDANGFGPGDDVDEALFAFFRSEMPHSWPKLALPNGSSNGTARPRPVVRPAQPAPPPVPSRRWFRSPRFALAASVALLIAGSYAVSEVMKAPTEQSAPGQFDEKAKRGQFPGVDPPADTGKVKIIESIEVKPDGTTEYQFESIGDK
jgi:hypothetical protein